MLLKDSAWNTLQRPNRKTFRFKFELLTVKHFNLIVINGS
jgi:hypothetical protein